MSKKKLGVAKYYLDNKDELKSLKKYGMIELLKDYGITIDPNFYDKDTVFDICMKALASVYIRNMR